MLEGSQDYLRSSVVFLLISDNTEASDKNQT